jgi:hypothetical protein
MGTGEEESLAATGRRMVSWDGYRGRWRLVYTGGTTCNRGQDLSLRVLYERRCECIEKLWDSNKEASRKHERFERSREGLTVGCPA